MLRERRSLESGWTDGLKLFRKTVYEKIELNRRQLIIYIY